MRGFRPAEGGAARNLAVLAVHIETVARRGLRTAAPSPAAAPRPAFWHVRISEVEAQAQLLVARGREVLHLTMRDKEPGWTTAE